MIAIIIILIAMGVSLTITNFFDGGDYINGTFWSISAVISIIALVITINEPKPIDVYRNKTVLEITYRDGVAIDSTIVFKNSQ